jgi:hypothetical protein
MGFQREEPTEFERGPGCTVSAWRNALLMMWSGAITSQALEVTGRAGKMLDQRYPGGQVAVSVSLPKVPIPDDEVRKHAGPSVA